MPGISLKCLKEMYDLVEENALEIGWYAEYDRDTYDFDTILVYPQEQSSSSFDSDDVEMIQWFDAFPEEEQKRIRLHGHSHVNFPVDPSKTDLDFEQSIIDQLKDENDFYVFLILNKRFALRIRAVNGAGYDETRFYNIDKEVFKDV